MQTVKNLLKKASDPYKVLMAYHATPLESGLSPAELLRGRKIRTTVPILPSHLEPNWPYLEQFREKDSAVKSKQKKNFDKRHSAKGLPDLFPGDHVWLPSKKVERTVIDESWHSLVLHSCNAEWPAKEKQAPPKPPPWNAQRNGEYTL